VMLAGFRPPPGAIFSGSAVADSRGRLLEDVVPARAAGWKILRGVEAVADSVEIAAIESLGSYVDLANGVLDRRFVGHLSSPFSGPGAAPDHKRIMPGNWPPLLPRRSFIFK